MSCGRRRNTGAVQGFGSGRSETLERRGLDRRTFIKGLGVAGGLVVGAGAARAAIWWDQAAANGYRILSADEVLISDAIAQALFPGEQGVMRRLPDAVELGATRFLDDLLVEMLDETMGNALRVLMHAIDEMAIFGGEGSVRRFHKRSLEERVAILRAWDGSLSSTRRSVFSALKIFYAMAYCEHPVLIEAMGFDYSCEGLDVARQA